MRALTLAALLAVAPVTASAEAHLQPEPPIVPTPVELAAAACAPVGAAFGAGTGMNPFVGGVAFFMCFVTLGNHPELIGIRN